MFHSMIVKICEIRMKKYTFVSNIEWDNRGGDLSRNLKLLQTGE